MHDHILLCKTSCISSIIFLLPTMYMTIVFAMNKKIFYKVNASPIVRMVEYLCSVKCSFNNYKLSGK